MIHTLRLDNYFPTPRKLVLGTNSSFGTESIKIERGAGWDGLNLTATWHIPGREEPLRVALLDGDAMDVPPEVTKEAKDGVLVLAGLASGVQRASCNVEYLILEQAGVYGGADAEPTPELAAQVLKAALQAKADAEAAAEDAAAAKANAENAAADAAKAGPYAEAARAAQEAAEAARDEAIAAQRAAENAAAAAAASKSAADTLAAEAARAAQAAENSKTTANNAANFAGENATAAQQAAATATDAANDAGQSASDAAASKAAAETAAKAAKGAQTAAAAARDAAAKSAEAAAKSEANAKQSADTLAESVENVVANTAAVAELKKKKAEIDDVAVGANAWSSKHIIDMLCPPLEESGNPVVCYPVAGYPLGVKAKWEPTQEGTGAPSPENIRPIKGRDSVTVERCGENLFDIAQFVGISQDVAYGLSETIDATGLIRIFGVPTVATDGLYYFRILYVDKVMLTKEYKVKWFVIKGDVQKISEIQADLSIVISIKLSPNTPVDAQFRFVFYTGDEPTTYTPYIGQTATLTLPETVYGGEVDAVTGEGQETWETIALDGTENWREVKNVPYPYLVVDILHLGKVTLTHLAAKCTAFPLVDLTANNNNNGFNGWENHLYIRWASLSTVDALKSYLAAQYAAGTPVQVCHKLLTEPVPFTATGAQAIPALAGANTVLTDADSVTVTGRADPIKRITDLEDAVASQT